MVSRPNHQRCNQWSRSSYYKNRSSHETNFRPRGKSQAITLHSRNRLHVTWKKVSYPIRRTILYYLPRYHTRSLKKRSIHFYSYNSGWRLGPWRLKTGKRNRKKGRRHKCISRHDWREYHGSPNYWEWGSCTTWKSEVGLAIATIILYFSLSLIKNSRRTSNYTYVCANSSDLYYKAK